MKFFMKSRILYLFNEEEHLNRKKQGREREKRENVKKEVKKSC